MRVLLLLLFAAPAFGHGGGLDADGCHRDKKRGGYHCHKGDFDGHFWKTRREGRKEIGKYRKSVLTHQEAKELTGFTDQACAPQDGRGAGRGRAFFGWARTGVSCGKVTGSRCEGSACGALHRTREGCERARFRCPASTEYYRLLEKECGRLDSCCKNSVDRMRNNGTRRAIGNACPEGYSRDMLRCESSYAWCVPDRPAEEPKDEGDD